MYKFTINITKNDLFKSSLNYIKHSKTFFFDLIFTFSAIIATVYTILSGTFQEISSFKKVLLILCCFLFPVIQPIILYIKSCRHAKKIKDFEVSLEFYDDKLRVYSKTESNELQYNNIYNFIKYKDMIVIMYDSIHGQIMPDRIFNENKDEFYNFVSEKIKYARESNK